MSDAPYPDLDPDLYGVVEALAADFPEPPHLLPIPEMRARLEAMAARTPFEPPAGMQVDDWRIEVSGRSVRLRAYRPAGWDGATAMLYMHGGGWALGSIEGHDQVCGDLAEDVGIAVVSIDYALSPEHPYPTALEECLAAFDHLLEGGQALPAPRRLWIGGDSAGGNLALGLGLRRRDAGLTAPAGQLLIYPCTDTDFTRASYSIHAEAPFLTTAQVRLFWRHYLGPDMQGDNYACPARADLRGLPATVILNAALDPLIDEAEDMAKALAAAGVPVRHLRAETLIHGLLRFRRSSARAREAFAWMTGAVRDTIGEAPT